MILEWNNGNGIVFEKKIELDEKYLFRITQQVKNNSKTSIDLYPYAQMTRNKIPDDIAIADVPAGSLDLLNFMVDLGWLKSKGEGRRLLKQNAVKINFKPHAAETFDIVSGEEYILKAGKLRLIKIFGK